MNRQEFINQLRHSISAVNDYAFVNDTIAYYEDYIETEIRKGRTEEEVLNQLGDPRLIAKSILATRKDVEQGGESQSYYEEHTTQNKTQNTYGMPVWLYRIVTLVVIVAVVVLGFMLLSSLMPFILFVACVYFFVKFIKNNFV